MPTASSHYHQLQPEDRVTIASLKQQNHSVRAIARQLHRSPATISRELQRNACSSGYGSTHAQCLSLQRRRFGRPAIKLHPESILSALVIHLLRLRWSPEQIALTHWHACIPPAMNTACHTKPSTTASMPCPWASCAKS